MGRTSAGLEFTAAQAVNKLAAITGSIQRRTKLGIFYLQYLFELIDTFSIAASLARTQQNSTDRQRRHAPTDQAQ